MLHLFIEKLWLRWVVCLPFFPDSLASFRDRYLVHYALEGLSRVGRVISGAEGGAMIAQMQAFDKMLKERWCPFTDAQSQF